MCKGFINPGVKCTKSEACACGYCAELEMARTALKWGTHIDDFCDAVRREALGADYYPVGNEAVALADEAPRGFGTGTGAAVARKPRVDVATDRQIEFYLKLKAELERDGNGHLVIDTNMTDATKSEASKIISEMLDRKKKAGIVAAAQRHADAKLTNMKRRAGYDSLSKVGKLYRHNGSIYRIVSTRDKQRAYAKVWDTDTGRYEAAMGMINAVIQNGEELNLEQVAALGVKNGPMHGMCMVCGRSLTDDTSIENGIGPICARDY